MRNEPNRNGNEEFLRQDGLDGRAVRLNVPGQDADSEALAHQFIKNVSARRVELKLAAGEIETVFFHCEDHLIRSIEPDKGRLFECCQVCDRSDLFQIFARCIELGFGLN